jgi:predicted HTH domain antitoxin
LPPNLDKDLLPQLEQEAREAVAVRLYREQKLSHGQVATFLGIGRGQVDEVLGRHDRSDEFSAEEISEQAGSLARLK